MTDTVATFAAPLTKYLEYIRADYRKWQGRSASIDKIRQDMIDQFEAGVEYEIGKKFIKVTTFRSVHSFIVIKDDGKFKAGDILKAASWKAPAKNFARGNVLDGTLDRVTWTGAA